MNFTHLKILAEYNQQDATFHSLFISVRRSTCFRRFSRPSSGAQNCTYSVRYWSDKYLTLYVQFWAPDARRKNRLQHVERRTEINKLWNVASCWLYSANILAMHGPMNVKSRPACFYKHICSVIIWKPHTAIMITLLKLIQVGSIWCSVLTLPLHGYIFPCAQQDVKSLD